MKINTKQLRSIIREAVKAKLNEDGSTPFEDEGISDALDQLTGAIVEFMSTGDSTVDDALHSEVHNILSEAVDECVQLQPDGGDDVALPAPHPAGAHKGQW